MNAIRDLYKRSHSYAGFACITVGIFFLYFLIRFITLRTLPPFVDELIYVRWAQLGFYDPALRLISLTDGKQPMYIWLVSLMMNSISNPLVAGRIVSIISGFGTLVGLGILGYRLFHSRAVATLSMLFYALMPFALIHDRLALYDSFLGTLYIWLLLIVAWFAQAPTLGKAFMISQLIGVSLLTKSSSMVFFVTFPLSFLLVNNIKQVKPLALRIYFMVLACAFGLLYASLLHLSPDLININQKNAGFVLPLRAIFAPEEISIFVANIQSIISWFMMYTGVPFVLLICASFFSKEIRSKQFWFILLSGVIPLLIISLVAIRLYPRYIFFTVPPFILIASYVLSHILTSIRHRIIKIIILGIALLWCIVSDSMIITSIDTAPLPKIDHLQFISGWSSGYGISDIIKYLKKQSEDGPITIAAEGIYGSLPRTAAELYFYQAPLVRVIGFEVPEDTHIPLELISTEAIPTYIIFNQTQQPPNWPMEKIMEIRKGNGNNFIRLYRLIPRSTQLSGR